jgi:hypothetical protein
MTFLAPFTPNQSSTTPVGHVALDVRPKTPAAGPAHHVIQMQPTPTGAAASGEFHSTPRTANYTDVINAAQAFKRIAEASFSELWRAANAASEAAPAARVRTPLAVSAEPANLPQPRIERSRKNRFFTFSEEHKTESGAKPQTRW